MVAINNVSTLSKAVVRLTKEVLFYENELNGLKEKVAAAEKIESPEEKQDAVRRATTACEDTERVLPVTKSKLVEFADSLAKALIELGDEIEESQESVEILKKCWTDFPNLEFTKCELPSTTN